VSLRFLSEPLVRAALAEDLGRAGDITSKAIVAEGARVEAVIAAREAGVPAGIEIALLAFTLIDPELEIERLAADGARIASGEPVVRIRGSARAVFAAERVALNFLCHLSGIATETRRLVDAVAAYPAKIVCTRKTTPGLRALEKYAVRQGGGANHRFGLDDAVLIKDNHIALAGSVAAAIERTRRHLGHLVKVEVEIDALDGLDEALAGGVDAVLLDNMSPDILAEAVRIVGGRAVTEASGRISLENARAVAATGVDLISSGAITHSAPILDLGLDIET
jgi:nicotinate-nucleotide pyrophosphorylase (carboxylating)